MFQICFTISHEEFFAAYNSGITLKNISPYFIQVRSEDNAGHDSREDAVAAMVAFWIVLYNNGNSNSRKKKKDTITINSRKNKKILIANYRITIK